MSISPPMFPILLILILSTILMVRLGMIWNPLADESESPHLSILSVAATRFASLARHLVESTRQQLSPLVPSDNLGRRTYALLCGINEYVDMTFSFLQYVESDTLQLATILRNEYVIDDMSILTGDSGTRDHILKALGDLSAHARPGDTVLIFFAGHGFIHNSQAYLIASDTRRNNLAATALSMADIGNALSEIRCHALTLVLDACMPASQTQDFFKLEYKDVLKDSMELVLGHQHQRRLFSTIQALGPGGHSFRPTRSINLGLAHYFSEVLKDDPSLPADHLRIQVLFKLLKERMSTDPRLEDTDVLLAGNHDFPILERSVDDKDTT